MDLWARAHAAVGLTPPQEEEEEAGLLASLQEAASLSRTQRIICAATCLAIALLFGSLSTLFVVVSPRKFASLYTLSNLCGLAATTFLVGPAAQVKKMAAPHRAAATATYLLSLIGTLVAALRLRSLILTLLFLIIQIVALCFYTLSYIPGAQGVTWGVLTRFVGE